jgi:hypothetical protein
MNKYNPDYVIHPIETVREQLGFKGKTFKDLCIDGLSFTYWRGYANDRKPLTDTAVQVIEKVTGIPSEYMRRLDTNYQESRKQ